ncbi:AlbA family DNA-binding domain-containing protein [Chryseobacterium aquaticum]|uniref:AlbA family DNA-binding domain-containing protein n=1 Tax=Chryseobacterium aquaticum TaxID=452084 RepID=UPI003F721093
MNYIIDLIRYENENTNVDFKSHQYKKEQNENFLKDIISLANAISKDDKYIIIGIKHHSNGNRDLIGIQEPFVDDATYQQLVDSNVEPTINFKYFPFEYDEKLFGIFKITNCSNPPYMMKKNYGNLKLGDAFIRKGSFQNRLSRKDIDNQNEQILNNDISENIEVSFEENDIVKIKNFEKIFFELPSIKKSKEIQEIIERKEKSGSILSEITLKGFDPFSFVPYEKRSLSELKENLKNIESDYLESDYYCFFEKNSLKINFFIHNESNDFLDVSIELIVEKDNRFSISDKIYRKPISHHPLRVATFKTPTFDEINYPQVEIKENEYKISSQIDKVKHKLPTEVFKVPLRITILPNDENISLKFKIKLYAKNIKNPILKTLEVIA